MKQVPDAVAVSPVRVPASRYTVLNVTGHDPRSLHLTRAKLVELVPAYPLVDHNWLSSFVIPERHDSPVSVGSVIELIKMYIHQYNLIVVAVIYDHLNPVSISIAESFSGPDVYQPITRRYITVEKEGEQ